MLEPEVLKTNRGIFSNRTIALFAELGIHDDFHKITTRFPVPGLRGLHFQYPPKAMAKARAMRARTCI